MNFDGETGPYVQYTFARASSILRKADYQTFRPEDMKGEYLTDAYAQDLLKLIEEFPKKVQRRQKDMSRISSHGLRLRWLPVLISSIMRIRF